jgi:hypothetical protein
VWNDKGMGEMNGLWLAEKALAAVAATQPPPGPDAAAGAPEGA